MIKYIPLKISNIDSSKSRYMSYTNIYEQTIKKILLRAEKEIKNDSYYRPIEEIVQNFERNIVGKTVKFKIVQDEENLTKHFLEAVISNNNNTDIGITRPLTYGDKETILRYLKNPDALKNITEHIRQMGQDLK